MDVEIPIRVGPDIVSSPPEDDELLAEVDDDDDHSDDELDRLDEDDD